jgi:tetratricopeptide (TPR) repeat protein
LIVQGKYEEALELAERAVAIAPDNADMLYRLAVCLAHLDRADEARGVLARCEKLRPGFVAVRRSWRPYDDDQRNALFFAGMDRHGLRN